MSRGFSIRKCEKPVRGSRKEASEEGVFPYNKANGFGRAARERKYDEQARIV